MRETFATFTRGGGTISRSIEVHTAVPPRGDMEIFFSEGSGDDITDLFYAEIGAEAAYNVARSCIEFLRGVAPHTLGDLVRDCVAAPDGGPTASPDGGPSVDVHLPLCDGFAHDCVRIGDGNHPVTLSAEVQPGEGMNLNIYKESAAAEDVEGIFSCNLTEDACRLIATIAGYALADGPKFRRERPNHEWVFRAPEVVS